MNCVLMGNKIDEIVIATSNRGKLAELQNLLISHGVKVRGLDEFDSIEPPVEDGKTFAANARLKASYYGRKLNRLVLADDSGLAVDALGGQPGVHSARFAGGEWNDRREQDRANYQKLLEKLKGISRNNRTGRFCCCLCVASSTKILLEVMGCLEGFIAEEPHGENGFGYDPVFWAPDKNKTVAELSAEEKNAISHRGRALRKLLGSWGILEAGSYK